MPFAMAGDDVVDAIGDVMDAMPRTAEDALVYNAGARWAKVATAFFKNGLTPSWSPGALFAGEQAFAAAALPVIPGWPELGAAFMAYAAIALVPGSTVPIATGAPPAPPVLTSLEALKAMPDHRTAGAELFVALYTWAKTGTVAGPLPWE